MKQADRVGSAILLFLAAFTLWQSIKLPMQATYGPGPGFFPLWLGIVLAVLSVLLFVSTFAKGADNSTWIPDRTTMANVGVVLLATAFTSGLTKYLGLTFASMLFMGFILFYLEPKNRKLNTAIIILTPIFVWLVFGKWLGVPLPRGPFGI